MPSRLVREGILTSERVDQLDPAAEVFYRRLMSKVDDHGLYDARLSILRTQLYALRVDRVREADIARWLAACETAGLIVLYAHDSGASSSRRIAASEMAGLAVSEKPYLQMLDTRWTARSEPKHPLPPDDIGKPLRATENSCKQRKTPVDLDGGGGVVLVGDVSNPPSTPARTRGDGVERFAMTPDWQPSEHFATLAHQSGLPSPGGAEFTAALAEFRSYWMGEDRRSTQAEWDHAMLKNLKQVRSMAPKTGSRRRASSEPAWRAEERRRMQQAVPGIAERAPTDPNTIDVEARDATPAALD